MTGMDRETATVGVAQALAGMAVRAVATAAALVALILMMVVAAGAASASPLEWQSGGRTSAAPHLSSSVELEVSGLVARLRLTQRFRNDRDAWVEGVYTFPLPSGAAVDGLRMRYGDTVIEGEIRERAEAGETYRKAREEGRRTVLVDRQRPNLFTTRLANVGPGETVEIEIAWQQSVDYDDGEYGLHLPLTLTPRYIPGRRPDGRPADPVPDAGEITPPMIPAAAMPDGHRLTLEGVIDAGVELASVTGRYHDLRVDRRGRAWRIAFDGPDVAMDRDLEITWRALPGTTPAASLFRGTGEAGGSTWLLFFQPPHGDGPRPGYRPYGPPRELVFVIDTSGSMHGDSLMQAKAALAMALSRLRPQDRFNVYEFNNRTRAFFPAPVPGDRRYREEAQALVAALEAEGGTEMEPALAAALRGAGTGRLRQIVFITDGSVGNESSLLELIRARLGDSRLFTVAIGSAPNRWFMRKAAEAGRGSALTIGDGGEVGERMERLFRRLERPALTDISVEWPAGFAAEAYPAPVPDLYHGEPLMVSARFERPPPPGSVVTVSGRHGDGYGDGYWMRQLVIDEAPAYPGVGKLWARARIEALEDARRAGAPEERIRAEVIRTALDHHLVSAHTSLVAVDRSPARPAHAGLARGRVPSLLPRGQTAAVFGLPATGTAGPWRRVLGGVCLLLGLALLVALRLQDLRRCRAA